ncbi:hypothetical protein [Larkinella terrae]|uniref:Uncharacterized protein n=1 Tax=Larkinella terrae TaxID=2025311 RepID=A0A7K0EDQ9_9BACT|nr:hypothetical protein [Larkinella terrae]MRS59852.1 hypothetical protein [Larkinella terrae]
MNALEILCSLKRQENKRKFPHLVPTPYPHYNDRTAWDLSIAIVDFLNLRGHFTSRCSILRTPQNTPWIVGIRKVVMTDILLVAKTKPFYIAIDPCSKQESFHRSRKDGGMEILVTNFQQFFDWYTERIERLSLAIAESTG